MKEPSRFFLFFPIFSLFFPIFLDLLPLFPDFGNFFAVKGGTLPPWPPSSYATDLWISSMNVFIIEIAITINSRPVARILEGRGEGEGEGLGTPKKCTQLNLSPWYVMIMCCKVFGWRLCSLCFIQCGGGSVNLLAIGGFICCPFYILTPPPPHKKWPLTKPFKKKKKKIQWFSQLLFMAWIRRYKPKTWKKIISKMSVDSSFTFSSYAWLCVFHCFHRLLTVGGWLQTNFS